MSDDLVKRLRKQSSSGRANHLSKADRLAAADRIEELEVECNKAALWAREQHASADKYAARIEELEAKLAKAVGVIEWALIAWDDHCEHGYNIQGDWVHDARATLAELTGGKND